MTDTPALFTDALLAGMKRAPLTLRRFVTRNHHREIGKELWKEAIFSVHLQDERLSDNERQVLSAMGQRLHGARSVI